MKRNVIETSRTRNLRSIKKNIYISCEGDTEEAYLLGLKKKYSKVATIKISNSNRTAAIDVVKNLISKYKSEYNYSDLKFCIFDCDENAQEQLNEAERLANKENAMIIFSNPCFEVWLLWHFEDNFSIQASRDRLKNKIGTLIQSEYWQCKEYPNLYELVSDKTKRAQKNSSKRLAELERDNMAWYTRESNPFSNFEKLIEILQAI